MRSLLALISGLADGRTVIFSSHSLADVQRVADHIGVLDRGRLLYQGPMRALIDSHTEPVWEVRVRGTSGTVGITLVILLLGPVIGEVPALGPWLPSVLVAAPNALLRHTAPDHYQRALITSVLLTAAAFALASYRGGRREAG
ncbi:MAG TPA: hypothetical protein VGX23_16940 [Actinocrinis sp.]|nr:hypothetical protein [Actinocrinis sp.]